MPNQTTTQLHKRQAHRLGVRQRSRARTETFAKKQQHQQTALSVCDLSHTTQTFTRARARALLQYQARKLHTYVQKVPSEIKTPPKSKSASYVKLNQLKLSQRKNTQCWNAGLFNKFKSEILIRMFKA